MMSIRPWAKAAIAAGLIGSFTFATFSAASRSIAADATAAKETKSTARESAELKASPTIGAKLPDLPEPISSFGAAVCGDYLYVYSGHTGEAHVHSRENLSKHFSRICLTKPQAWEALPMETALQSVSLVSDGKKLYRVGGLAPQNGPDDPEQLESVAEVGAFDPATKTWSKLPPLPSPRSSHDAWIVDGVLYAVGGWKLSKADHVWHDHAVKLKLGDEHAKWEELPAQPFRRRALSVVAVGQKLYAIGGMTANNKPSTDVHVFDIKSQTWAAVPSLPGKGMSGFGCGAAPLGDRLYATTMEGHVFCLADGANKWQAAGDLQTPRFFHRLLPAASGALLAIGGASEKLGHLKSLEWFVPKAQ
jgi:N-acetylneuraminic acid mutarotase